MELKQTITNFINSVSPKSIKAYEGKINAFYEFLVTHKGINDNSFESYLASMRKSEIIESLDVYINQNKINKTSVAWHYIAVIKRYFIYLYSIGIKNSTLIMSFGLEDAQKESLNYHLKEFINHNSALAKIDVKSELSYEEMELLLIECDEQIYDLLKDKKEILNYKKYPTKYNDFMYSLLIKIMAYTGIKYNVINTIKMTDLDEKHGSLIINGFVIHLPDTVADQVREYKEIRSQLNNESELLFTKVNGENLRLTTGLIERLEIYIGRTDTVGITKFGIIEMIKRGINQSLIQDFTGVGKDIFNYCQTKVNGEKKQYASRYIDSKLRSMPINDII